MTVEGVTFLELEPRYSFLGSHFRCTRGDVLSRFGGRFWLHWGGIHIDWGKPAEHDGRECPPRWVEGPPVFWMARTELTNSQFERYDPKHVRAPDSMRDNDPVVDLDWDDAVRYSDWLSTRGALAVRPPTELEWQCAARAGGRTEYCCGDDARDLAEHAWFAGNSGNRVHPVASRRSNTWGLYDMHGNVWELVGTGPVAGHTIFSSGREGSVGEVLLLVPATARTTRAERWFSLRESPDDLVGELWKRMSTYCGGSFCDAPEDCRSARLLDGPDRKSCFGFRPAADSR